MIVSSIQTELNPEEISEKEEHSRDSPSNPRSRQRVSKIEIDTRTTRVDPRSTALAPPRPRTSSPSPPGLRCRQGRRRHPRHLPNPWAFARCPRLRRGVRSHPLLTPPARGRAVLRLREAGACVAWPCPLAPGSKGRKPGGRNRETGRCRARRCRCSGFGASTQGRRGSTFSKKLTSCRSCRDSMRITIAARTVDVFWLFFFGCCVDNFSLKPR